MRTSPRTCGIRGTWRFSRSACSLLRFIWERHLEFLCKWGLAATVKAQQAAGRFGALVGVAFSVVGILIIISFRYDWHPFSVYLPNK